MENIKNFVDEHDYEKILSKVSKLEIQVKKLTSDNSHLRAKVNNLENIVDKICSSLNLKNNFSLCEKNYTTENNHNDLEETWLYYVEKGVSKEKIEKKLNMNANTVVIELKANNWLDESSVMIDFLNGISTFKEFSEDWSSMSNKELNHFLKSILSTTLLNDTIVILRNVPDKKQPNYEKILSSIATVAELLSNTWNEIELNNELIGKMALVLESTEELQILNIVKNDSRLILIVEPLFN